MSQPEWRLIAYEKTDCQRLYEDTTGVYDPELEYADALEEGYVPPDPDDVEEVDEDEDPPAYFQVFRVPLEQYVLDDDARLIDVYGHRPWFEDNTHDRTLGKQDEGYCYWCCRYVSFQLSSAARSVSMPLDDLRLLFCSDEPEDRALAVLTFAGCWGWMSFDAYPQTLSEQALEKRWTVKRDADA